MAGGAAGGSFPFGGRFAEWAAPDARAIPDKTGEMMQYLFGPVPSRRLGRSLGIDVIPHKTCTYNCIYCESGPTTRLTLKRERFAEPGEVLRELDAFFRRFPSGADVLTFSSGGEPTLYEPLEELIGGVKKAHPGLPLVVLTNGSLLWDPAVRKGLLGADRVVPSLDAVSEEVFRKLNRPHQDLDLPAIVEGLRAFRLDYRGEMHLEIMLVSGVNDSAEELALLARAVEKIGPDRIELNTVVRPPARTGTKGLSEKSMTRAALCFPAGRTDIIGTFSAPKASTADEDLEQRILQTIQRRPCTIAELAVSLGVARQRLEREAKRLEEQKKLRVFLHDGKPFLCPFAPNP